MSPEELLELTLLLAVGENLRQEGSNLLLGDNLVEPLQLLHQARQVLGGDMDGFPLQRHELQNHNET